MQSSIAAMQSSIADMSTVQEGRMSSIESTAADHSSVIEQLTARIDTQVSTLQ